jgi:hypothetical protein
MDHHRMEEGRRPKRLHSSAVKIRSTTSNPHVAERDHYEVRSSLKTQKPPSTLITVCAFLPMIYKDGCIARHDFTHPCIHLHKLHTRCKVLSFFVMVEMTLAMPADLSTI